MGVAVCAGAACCAGAGCCKCLCSACTSCGVHNKMFSRIGYVFFSFFWILLSLCLLWTAKPLFEHWIPFIKCPNDESYSCFGISAVFRMSFTLVIFHAFVLLICLTWMQWAAYFHDGLWSLKFILVFAIFICFFFVSNDFFVGYGNASWVISVIFLVY